MKKLFILIIGVMIGYAVQAQTVLYHENFELTSLADSVIGSGTPSPWAINTRIAAGGVRCDSNFVQTSDTAFLMTTPVINCTGWGNVVLKFSHICKIELLDAGIVEISINGGAWTKLTAAQYIDPGSQFASQASKFSSNTYPLVWSPAQNDAKPLNSWWRNEQFDISSLAGNVTSLRIRFALIDGNANGTNWNHGWFLDNIQVVGAISELIPPVIAYKPPIIQDTVFNTGPFDISAWIKDPSGIDSAWIVYTVNGGANNYVPMTWVSDSTYTGSIPSYTWNTAISYYVHAVDNSLSHNGGNATIKNLYIKKGPSNVIVGTGTNTGTFPFYMNYGYSRSGSIYTQAEIGMYGLLQNLAWNVSTSAATAAPVKVYLKSTTATAMPEDTWDNLISGATLVYNTSQSFSTAGWATINLSPSFLYASGNLMVLCESNYGGSGHYPYPYFYYSDATDMHEYFEEDYSPPTSSGYVDANRPNITLSFQATNYMFDAGISQIVAPTGTVIPGTNVPVTVKIKNYSVDTMNTVKIKYSVDGVIKDSLAWSGVLYAGTTTANFNIDTASFGLGLHTIKAWTVKPNGTADQNVLNDTATGSFFVCTAALAGPYTIGGGGDFANFAAAIGSLTNCGISGPVTFSVLSGTYNEQLSFVPISGTSATNKIIFKPAAGANVTITANVAGGTLSFVGADYITFDGSNNGTTSRNMTIINANGGGGAVVNIASLGIGAGATHDVVKNCNLTAGSKTAITYGIFIGSDVGNNGQDNDYITIQNNEINTAYYGIVCAGVSGSECDSLRIISNTIGSSTLTNSIGYAGMDLSYVNGGVIKSNTIFNIITNASTPFGLSANNGVVNSEISKNVIHTIQYSGTYGYGARGIYLNPGVTLSNNTISNNMISSIGGYGSSSFSYSTPVGIFLDGASGGFKIYYNTVNMNGVMANSSGSTSAAFLVNSSSNSNIDLRNNVFVNTMTNSASSTYKQYAIYCGAANTAFTTINNNDYYVAGAQSVLGYLGTDMATIAAWRTASGQDVNSLNAEPIFINADNLHTFSNSINNTGAVIISVVDDIDGEIRNGTTPDIGADEFTPLANDIGMISILAPVSGCGYASEAVTIRFKNFGNDPITVAEMYYSLNGAAAVHETFNGSVASGATHDYTFTNLANIAASGNYTIDAWVDLAGDPNTLNDTISNYSFYSGYNFSTGPYTMGFEPTEAFADWSVLDANTDTYTWAIPTSGSANAHSGTNSAMFNNNTVLSGNDWLFSRCFNLDAGTTYKVEYWYKTGIATAPQNIVLAYGNAASAAGMTSTIQTLNGFTNTDYQKATITFVPATTAAYYFGWHATSNPSSYDAYIDDINITSLPPQEATAVSITAPFAYCDMSNAELVTVGILNSGSAIINGNLTVSYSANGSAPVTNVVGTAIAVGDTLFYSFAEALDMNVGATDSLFNISVWVNLIGDPFAYNDTAFKQINSRHVPGLPSVIGDTVAYGGSAVLSAISPDMIAWYTAYTGGSLTGNGSTFTTPNLFTTTTYYASAFTEGDPIVWNFDSDLEGWTASDPCGYSYNFAWDADGGAGALYCPDPSVTSGELVVSPVTNVAGATAITLSFSHRYSTESCCDEGYVAYRLDGGPWTLFTPTVNPYSVSAHSIDPDPLNSCNSTTLNAFAGTQSSYAVSSGTISTTGSSTIEIAFVFASDVSGGSTGWYIDNVSISGLPGCASDRVADTAKVLIPAQELGVVSLISPAENCTNGTENVTFSVTNGGSANITSFNASYKANTAAVVTETFTTLITPGDTLNYTFASPLNTGISAANNDTTISLILWVNLATDPYSLNDTVERSFDFALTSGAPVVSNATIPYATSTTLTATSTDPVVWYDALTGGNILGNSTTFTTPLLYANTVYYVEASSGLNGIMINNLLASGSAVVDQDAYAGDDRGGVAVTRNYYYCNGDAAAVRFDMPGLTNPVTFDIMDGIFSDLSGDGTVYTLWNGTAVPVSGSAYTVNSIRTLNDDLSLGSTIIPISQNIVMGDNSDNGIYAGKSFVILYNGSAGVPAGTFYRIDIPSGLVTVLGSGYTFSPMNSENWSIWGVAEVVNQDYAVSFANGDIIERLNLTSGNVTTVASFTNLSDMASFTVAPWYNRWYFHYENSGQFGGSSETSGYADASIQSFYYCPSDRIPDTVFVSGIPACDVGVTSINTPVSGIELSNAETVSIVVHNFGTVAESNIPVSYSLNGTTVNGTVAGPLAPGADYTYSFTTTVDMSGFDTYSLAAYTALGCDVVTVNDTSISIVVNDSLMYCPSYANSTYDMDIGNVTFGSINNGVASPILNNPTCTATYTNYTSIAPAQLIAGSSESISITKIEQSSYFYNALINVYIDWNRNGQFDLPAEKVFGMNTGYDETFPTVSGYVSVPTTGVVFGENLLMRVVVDEYSVAPACGDYSYGETEDYYVVVSPQLQYDAGVTSIIQPASVENEAASVPVQVIVRNYGFDTIKNSTGLFVGYSVNGQAPVNAAWSNGNLAPGATTLVTLAAFNVPAATANICAWTSMAPDTNFGNDSTCKSFYGTPIFDAGVTSFIQPASLNGNEGVVEHVQVVVANHGTDTLFSIPVSYKVNGVVQATQTWTGVLLPGATTTLTFTQTYVTPSALYDLCAYTALVPDGDHANDTLCINPYGIFLSSLPYYDDFNSGSDWFATADTYGNIWELGMPAFGATNSAHSAPNAWDVNLTTNYTPYAAAYLYTQNFDFSTAINAKIAFWINVAVENCCDGLTLQYSIDSSATWNTLGIVADPLGVNWYDATTGSYPSWTSTSGWEKVEYRLTALNGQPNVRFRFYFHSDVSNQIAGASVDDISITIPQPYDAGVELIKQPVGSGPSGASKVVKVKIRNYGTNTLTSIPVSYVVNGGTPVNATWTGSLVANDTITYTFATPMIVPGGAFSLCAYTGLATDGDHLNDTICTSLTGIVTFVVPWSDDMEGTVYWFDAGGNSSWEWGVPTSATINTAHSPVNCWKTNLDGYYMNSSVDYLYTPYFDFTQVNDATLDFWHWYQTESGVDGGKIEYSLNGTNWITLGYVGDPAATNWYSANISGAPHFTGNSGGWIHSTYNLSSIPTIVNATAPVQFRYKFYSSASTNNYDGWAVDDFAITAPPIPKDAGVSVIMNPSAPTTTGSAVSVQVTIENYGTDTLVNVPVAYSVNGGTPTTETWLGTLQPATTANYSFTTTFISPASTYDICAFTKKTGDFYKFNDTTCVSITPDPAALDAGCILVLSPGDTTIFGDSVTVAIRIQNFGTNTLTTIPIGYKRNGVVMATATWTGSLVANATADYTFVQKFASPLSNYSLCGFTALPSDAYAGNNESCAYPQGVIGFDEYSGEDLYLWQNAPNPANGSAYIAYQIPTSGKVTFEVRDMVGQLLYTESQNTSYGRHYLELNVSKWATGVYYYTMEFEGQRLTRKMVISK